MSVNITLEKHKENLEKYILKNLEVFGLNISKKKQNHKFIMGKWSLELLHDYVLWILQFGGENSRPSLVEYVAHQAKRFGTKGKPLWALDMEFKMRWTRVWRVSRQSMCNTVTLEGRMHMANTTMLSTKMHSDCKMSWYLSWYCNAMSKISKLWYHRVFGCFLGKRDFLVIIYIRDYGILICKIMCEDHKISRIMRIYYTGVLEDENSMSRSF